MMIFLSLTVDEHILLVLNDLNESRDVFPLKKINTMNHYPLFQALIICKEEGFIEIAGEFTPTELENEPAHRKIELAYSPIITMKGLIYLKENGTQLKEVIGKLSYEYIDKEITKEAEKGDSAATKIKDVSNVLSDVEAITKKGSSLVTVAVKLYDYFKSYF